MAHVTFAPAAHPPRPPAIPVGEALPRVMFCGLTLLIAIHFVGAEEGTTSVVKGRVVHEFVYDGRHLLGFPCH